MNTLVVSPSPHVRTRESVARIMWMVVLSLLPAGIAGVYIFGLRALWIILIGVIAAIAAEYLCARLMRRPHSLRDGSAVLTGLLLAYNVGAGVPLWIPAVGAVVAIVIGKTIFGGLGRNIFNPALIGRAFLMASWPYYMTSFTRPFSYDAVTQATPLALLKEGQLMDKIPYLDLLLGRRGGCIGEVCIIALLGGALFLFLLGYIYWQIPFTYVATTGIFMFIFGGPGGLLSGDWLFHILTGGLILGAFFMATDYVTSPLSGKGKIIFGIGCGILTGVIRVWGGYPEGVSYAILMMNACVPLIDRYARPRIYGT